MKMHTYLNFAGNTEEVFQFYRSIFGGEFSSLIRFKDMPMPGVEIPEEARDKIMHISLPIGESDSLMASDSLESLGQQLTVGNNVYVYMDAGSRTEADRIFSGLAEGAEIEMNMADMPWGDYFGSLKDRFGVMWMVSCPGNAPQ